MKFPARNQSHDGLFSETTLKGHSVQSYNTVKLHLTNFNKDYGRQKSIAQTSSNVTLSGSVTLYLAISMPVYLCNLIMAMTAYCFVTHVPLNLPNFTS
jgi:hypothetical protein